MADIFPTALEAHADPTENGSADTPSVRGRADMLKRLALGIERAQAKIGIDNSAVTTSLDYQIKKTTVDVKVNGTTKGTRKGVNFVDTGSVTWTATDDGPNNEVDVTATVIAGGAASDLATTGAAVNVSAASPPVAGQVLTATDATHATWQTPSGGGFRSQFLMMGA